MGYHVKAYPPAGRSGFIEWGRLAPPHGLGTYYSHPSAAKLAAENWVKKHPGGRAEIIIYRMGAIVDEVL